jgi:hypothetical protein
MSYSTKQTKIGDLRKILEKYRGSDTEKGKRYEIYSNRAKSPYTILIEVGADFREHKELQRWDSNWRALQDMMDPRWHPEKPLEKPEFMFDNIPLGISIIGLAKEDLEHLLSLQDRKHLWGLVDFEGSIIKMRHRIKVLNEIRKKI